MKVSVCIQTYNHEPYIAQAIESVLMQQTDFPFEIIIGEDDSSDNTRAIVKSYKERYPDKIRLFLNDRKNVIYINGRPTGRWNFVNNLKNATGQYIALLDGDDCWTDPLKLHKQVDFLDNHPDFAICFHNVRVVYEDESRNPHDYCPPDQKEVSTLEDILQQNFIPTCSVMFRNNLFGELPEWYYQLPMGDWSLHVLNATHGAIAYFDSIMSAYRKHESGIWSGTVASRNLIGVLRLYDCFYKYYPASRETIYAGVVRVLQELSSALIIEGYSYPAQKVTDVLHEIDESLKFSNLLIPYLIKRNLFGKVYAGLMFSNWQRGERTRATAFWIKAIVTDPRWLLNRDVWVIGTRSIMNRISGLFKGIPKENTKQL